MAGFEMHFVKLSCYLKTECVSSCIAIGSFYRDDITQVFWIKWYVKNIIDFFGGIQEISRQIHLDSLAKLLVSMV